MHKASSLCLLVALGCCISARSAETPAAKRPAPGEEARAAATQNVRAVYQEELAKAKTPAQKGELAKTILESAVATENDWDGRYVMLATARDLAQQAGELATAMSAIDEIHAHFVGDPLAAKYEVLTAALKGAKPSQATVVLDEAQAAFNEALAADHFEAAKALARVALSAAKLARDPARVKSFTAHEAELARMAQMHAEMKQAATKLEQAPADPDANARVGQYLCFVKQDWDRGLPMLLLGSDAAQRKAAKADLLAPATSDGQAAVGDLWWDLAEGEEGAVKTRLQARAALWYNAAKTELTGLAKARVDKRLALVEPAATKPETEKTETEKPVRTVGGKSRDRREASGTMHVWMDQKGELRLNGQVLAATSGDGVAVPCMLKVGDLMTFTGTNDAYDQCLLFFFRSNDGKSLFFSEVTGWRGYTPANAAKWWEVKPSKTDRPAVHSTKDACKFAKVSFGYGPDPIWDITQTAKSKNDPPVFLYHVVTKEDLAELVVKPKPRQIGKPVEGTLTVTCQEFADIMINREPLMALTTDEVSQPLSFRPGDVITVKVSNVKYGRGFKLHFVTKDGKGQFSTNNPTWKSYLPHNRLRWWELDPPLRDGPVEVQPNRDFKAPSLEQIQAIWGPDKEISFLYHIVTNEDLKTAK